jgi:predicted Zn-dependent peptidase
MAKVTVLPNGLRLITRHKKEAASASLAIWIGVGSRYETRNQNGIYHLVEHLLFQGTSKRQSAKEISEAIEGIGGLLNAFTGQECTCYLTKVPAYRLDQALEVLSDLVLNPLFRLADFEKERRVVVEEIKMHQDQPGDRAEMSLFELLFPRHPLGADIAGNSKSLQNMELARVQEAWQAKYVARNMVLSITGAIDSFAVEKKTEQYFDRLVVGRRPRYRVFKDKGQNRFRVERKDTAETHICLGGITLGRYQEERYALDILNAAIGVGASSRLYQEIRDKRGLAYFVHSSLDFFQDTGCQVIEASCDPDNVRQVLDLIWQELDSIRRNGISSQEMARVKEFIRGGFLLRLEDTLSEALWLGERLLLENCVPSMSEEVKKYDQVRDADVQALADRLFRLENYSGVVVGPLEDEKCWESYRAPLSS